MATSVTLSLPDNLYDQAKRWATIVQRDIPTLLTETLALALTPVHAGPAMDTPVGNLSDKQITELE